MCSLAMHIQKTQDPWSSRKIESEKLKDSTVFVGGLNFDTTSEGVIDKAKVAHECPRFNRNVITVFCLCWRIYPKHVPRLVRNVRIEFNVLPV